jgi:hypothetical protein
MKKLRPLHTSQAQIQIIIQNAKDSDTHSTSAVALGSLSEDQRAGFDRVHALAKAGCSHGSAYPPGPWRHTRLGQRH